MHGYGYGRFMVSSNTRKNLYKNWHPFANLFDATILKACNKLKLNNGTLTEDQNSAQVAAGCAELTVLSGCYFKNSLKCGFYMKVDLNKEATENR